MVNPALLPQLSHDGVNPREAGPTLRPLGQCLWVAVPRDLDTDGVVLHLVKAGVVGGSRVEELTPQQLTIERQRRGAVLLHLADRCGEIPLPSGEKQLEPRCFRLHQSSYVCYLPVEVSELEVEKAAGEAAKAQVRTEPCRACEE